MSFNSDAGLFVHQMDVTNDRLLLMRLSEADLCAASFLDQRLLQAEPGKPQRAMQWAEWSVIADQTQALANAVRDDARFIFHISHVGSTLLARLLGEAADTLALREPFVLRQFAELCAVEGKPHSPWPPGRYAQRLPIARKWLSRTFHAPQRALIKATSFVSEIASDILENKRAAIFMTLSPERFLQTILAGEASRRDLAGNAPSRLQRLNARLETDTFRLWELDEAQRAALGWACEMAALEAASGDHVMWLDFDAFLSDPATHLARAAHHLGTAMTPEEAQKLVSGPIMQRYSKAPEHGYSPQLREEVLAGAARDRKADISAALQWLDQAAKDHSAIASALARA